METMATIINSPSNVCCVRVLGSSVKLINDMNKLISGAVSATSSIQISRVTKYHICYIITPFPPPPPTLLPVREEKEVVIFC